MERIRAKAVLQQASIAILAIVPLVTLSAAADPYQPVRALAFGVAGLLAAVVAAEPVALRGRSAIIAFVCLGAASLFVVVSALLGGWASAVFGVHGRFQGLLSGAAAILGVGVGVLAVRRMRAFATVVAVVLVLESVVMLVQVLGRVPVTGTIGNPVLAGGWMAVATAIVAARARSSRGGRAAAYWVAAALGALATGASGSRGAWFGLVVAGVVLLISAPPALRRRAGGALAVVLVLGAIAGGALGSGKLDPRSLLTGSAGARMEIWGSTIDMIADHPLAGVGAGRYLYEYPAYQSVRHAGLEPGVRADQAHGVVMHTAAESGVPAALAAGVFIAIALAAGMGGVRRGEGASLLALAGLSAWSAQALFGISTVELDGLAFMLAGVLLVEGRRHVVAQEDERRSGRMSLVVRVGLGALAGLIIVSCAVYIRADLVHLRGLESFYAGRMQEAWDLETRASDLNPLVDTYRVAASDAALYGAGSLTHALAALGEGLRLEPASFDLALARARVLQRSAAPAGEVIDAYGAAYKLYPLGVEVGHEAIAVALSHDEITAARGFAQSMLVSYPNDPIALSAMEESADAP